MGWKGYEKRAPYQRGLGFEPKETEDLGTGLQKTRDVKKEKRGGQY